MIDNKKHIITEKNKYKILKDLKKKNIQDNDENSNLNNNDLLGKLIESQSALEGESIEINNNERNVPINKGHYEMDTQDRKLEFEKNLSKDWEDDYKKYRKLWIDLAKNKTVRDYPLLVDLELSSICNLHCPMCYTTTEDYLKKVNLKYMNHDIFKKVIDEISGKVFAIRLSLRGESTLSKNFIDAVKYAKGKGILEVSSLTHGKKLTGKYLEELVEAGIDWITISVDGMGEDYNRIRHPLTWEGTIGRLKEIKELKKSLGKSRPVIKVQGIWPSIKPYPTEFYEALLPYTDLIAYNPLIDYLDNDQNIEYIDNFSCPQLYQRLVINSDNNAVMCANDEKGEGVVGNVRLQTVKEIWNGKRMNFMRKLHLIKDGFKKMHTCKVCYYPRKTEGSEKAKVGKREITIENYTNRSQIVGK